MAITTLVLGFTGEGKSYSIKNLNPEDTGIIQINSKPLPFRNNQDFAKRIRVSCDFMDIQRALLQAKSSVIVIDDFQYLMINEQLKIAMENLRGDAVFAHYHQLAYKAWSVLNCAIHQVAPSKRVYILSHLDEENGRQKMRTIGKMFDNIVIPEAMVTTVLQTKIQDGQNYFQTKNNGFNIVKTPEGLFDLDLIPNDLEFVDSAICEYYGIPKVLPRQ